MWLTILGLLIATVTAIYSAITGDGSDSKKRILASLAILGFLVGCAAAVYTDKQADKQAVALAKLAESASNTGRAMVGLYSDYHELLKERQSEAGQPSALNALGGAKRYYVRLAYGRTKEELLPYETALLSRFPGARETKLIQVRATSAPSGYELVFGTGLALESAEAFERLANSQGLANGRAEIHAEN